MGRRTWASLAAREFGISTKVIDLPAEIIERIKEAQWKQDIRVAEDAESETA